MIMNKTIHVNFNQKDISDLISKLETLHSDIKDYPEKLTKEIAYDGLTHLDMLYASTPYQNNVGDINTRVRKTLNGYSIIASGQDVIYEEFGTGDMGEQNSHPEKSEYNLNDYNSGSTIRSVSNQSVSTIQKLNEHNITSGKYWTYVRDGQLHYTQGIPAGKQVFNTRNYIIEEGIKKANDKLVGDMLSKL